MGIRRDDRRQPDRVRHTHGRRIERVLERAPNGDTSLVAVLVVPRAPRLVADAHRDRNVVHERGGGERGRVVAAVAERGKIDEWLEGRAGLPAGQRRAVELARRVLPSADERPDLAARGIDRHQRRLQPPPRVGAAQPRQPCLQSIETAHDGRFGEALQRQVERRVHGCALAAVAEPLLDLGARVVREVRRRLPGRRDRRHPHRRGPGGLPVGGRQHPELVHPRQDDVAPRAGALRIHHRRVAVGRANHPGQQRRLGRRQLVDLLAEIRAGGGAEAADGAPVALPQVDLVEVRLEDLRFRVAPLDQCRQPGLAGLAQERAAGADQPVLDELLRDGRAALQDAAGAHVGPRGAHQAVGVDPAVLEETVILGREDGVDQDQRHVGQPHGAVVLTGPVIRAGQHLRLERAGADVVPAPTHARDAVVADLHEHRHAGSAAEVDLPASGQPTELAGHRRHTAGVVVLQPRQRAGQVDAADVDARHERLGGSVDEGRPPLLDTLEARERDPGIDDEGEEQEPERRARADAERPQPVLTRPRPSPRPRGQRAPAHVGLCPPSCARGDGKGFSTPRVANSGNRRRPVIANPA